MLLYIVDHSVKIQSCAIENVPSNFKRFPTRNNYRHIFEGITKKILVVMKLDFGTWKDKKYKQNLAWRIQIWESKFILSFFYASKNEEDTNQGFREHLSKFNYLKNHLRHESWKLRIGNTPGSKIRALNDSKDVWNWTPQTQKPNSVKCKLNPVVKYLLGKWFCKTFEVSLAKAPFPNTITDSSPPWHGFFKFVRGKCKCICNQKY